jgi:predicted GNAT family acetyltransferase
MNTKKYKPLKLYELIDMNRGGIYHDFTHGIENRRAWWGFQPYYPPNDEPGFVNENFIKFVESRDNYLIRRPIFHMTTLQEEFNNAVKNLSEYINKSKNSYKFYNNLRKLQEYLIECGSINEEMVLKPLRNEDGSTKFSTDNNVGGDQFSTYNNKSTEPSIENNLDANSFMYHENEKNLKQNNINERTKAWIPGSKAVTVKQKCRLGGLNGKSVACNQGDISNLQFSSLDEETKLDQGFVDGWYRYDILHGDEIAGEMEVSNRDKYMILNKIYINPEHRGMGHANDAMKILIDYADKHNKIIALTPDNVWGGNKQKLRKWYSSLGFVSNKGSKADYKIQAAMIRRPQNI